MRTRNAANICCLVLSVSVSQQAVAYGYMDGLVRDNARGTLVEALIKGRAIRYCLTIDESVADRYGASSLDTQINLALRVWLHLIFSEEANRKIEIIRVPCESPALNLKIDIGPKPDMTDPERAGVVTTKSRAFSRIRINTLSIVYPGDLHMTVHDFAEIAQRIKHSASLSLSDLTEVVLTTYRENQTVWDIETLSGISFQQVRASTYHLLVHAIGHSFGLCDTDTLRDPQSGIERSCDANTLVTAPDGSQPLSIMDGTQGLLRPTPDDINGVRSLYTRYGGH